MFNLCAVPEIGIGSKTICDVCMRKQSSEYLNCGLHKLCDTCCPRFSCKESCPLCGKSTQRCIEKSLGRSQSMIPSTYIPNECINTTPEFHHFIMEDSFLEKSGSNSSLMNSISSSEMGDSEEGDFAPHTYHMPCTDIDLFCGDIFASLDAEYNRREACKSDLPQCGLIRSELSLYRPCIPSMYADSMNPEQDRISDFVLVSRQAQPISAAFMSCDLLSNEIEGTISLDENGSKRRTLQKAKCLSGSEFQRMVELCKDM